MLNDAVEGDGAGEGEAATLLPTLSLRYVLILCWSAVSMGAKAGADADADIFPRSSADLDHGFLDNERKSPMPPLLKGGGDGEDGVRFGIDLASGTAVVVRASDKSATDLQQTSAQHPFRTW